MKKLFAVVYSVVLIITISVMVPGCVKDSCRKAHTYTFFEPVYKTAAEVRANIKSNSPRQINNPGKLYIRGQYIFLNEIDKGIHVINNANPSNPVNVAFIDIPGNMDIAVKGNTLYADLYTDLITLDITDAGNVQVKKIIDNVFPYRSWGNGYVGNNGKIVVDWIRRDTTVVEECSRPMRWTTDVLFLSAGAQTNGSGPQTSGAAASPFGMGGSMARFAIVNDRLYAISTSDLNVFNISAAANPSSVNKVSIGWNIETLYPFRNKLFIGSQSGMFIYNINNPDKPSLAGQFSHVRSCDPVIADDNYAYVTLRSGTPCQGFTNELDVLQLNNIIDPTLVKVYSFMNPHGLSKDGNLLFICDGADGLKIYNAENVNNLQLIKKISGIETYDVIAYNNLALLVAKDGLYQYDYSDAGNIRLLSKITVSK